MFDRDALRAIGVNREHGVRLATWLRDIEGAMRRLILAAALAVTPPAVRRPGSCAAARAQPAAASPRRPGFCVFRVGASGEPSAHKVALRAEPKPAEPEPYGHIAFPGDPLLSLGATRQRAPRDERNAAPRPRNPLDRSVRLSRHDPDWRPREDAPLWSILRPARPSAPRKRPAPHTPQSIPESLHDWRRCHDEWRKLVPAPDLAARLDALQRVVNDPSAAIASAARRLNRSRGSALTLAREAAPRSHPPNRAAHIATAGHTASFARRCHAALVTPDTS
jgi:hypothetical protein